MAYELSGGDCTVKKYSKIYPVEGEEHFGFRYNYADAMLEYVSRQDYKIVDGEHVDIILDDWSVITGIGLSRDEWKDNPDHWVGTYKAELDDEAARLANTFE